MQNIRYLFYLYVFIGYSLVFGGSYEDFFLALERDNAHDIRTLLQRGMDPNSISPQRQPALLQALRGNAFAVAGVLIAHPDTQLDILTAADESPLMLAALKRQMPLCLQLLARDASVNKPGWAPLHYAATGGDPQIVRLLLDHFAYIDAESPNGTTPLMMAARYGSPDAVKVLLDAGADTSIRNVLGLTALDFAKHGKAPELTVDLIAGSIRAGKAEGNW